MALAPYLRPAARATLKFGFLAVEKAREAAAVIGEGVDDVAAEVQEALRTERGRCARRRSRPGRARWTA